MRNDVIASTKVLVVTVRQYLDRAPDDASWLVFLNRDGEIDITPPENDLEVVPTDNDNGVGDEVIVWHLQLEARARSGGPFWPIVTHVHDVHAAEATWYLSSEALIPPPVTDDEIAAVIRDAVAERELWARSAA